MIRILILFLALASGGFAAWFAVGGQDDVGPATILAEPVNEIAMDEVLVAVGDLGRGTALNAANVRWQVWPEESVTGILIVRSARPNAVEELEGFKASNGLVDSEPIREDKLAQPGSGYLSALLTAGKRASAVRITAENTAGGFILPDDRVDVVHTRTGTESDDGVARGISTTILTNIRVLAVDQLANLDDAGSSVVGRTATLEVEPKQVEILTAAESSGAISLSLRSAADNNEPPNLEQDHGSMATVRVIRSGQTHLVQVRRTEVIDSSQLNTTGTKH